MVAEGQIEDNNMNISVIMPVYNMKELISDSIESWLCQSIDKKELICVDDGSDDGTLEIIKKYSRDHANVRVISLESNHGAGYARNKGIEYASGEYISFLDGDDKYISIDALEMLYKYASMDECDVCGGLVVNNYCGQVNEYSRFRSLFAKKNVQYVDIEYRDFQDDYYFQGFIFRRGFLLNNELIFPLYKRYQDPPFLVKALNTARRIRVVNVEFYEHKSNYKVIAYDSNRTFDLLAALFDNLRYSEENKLRELFSKTVDRINDEYFSQIYQGIRYCEPRILEKVTQTYDIVKRNGYHLEPLEYFFYLDRRECKLEEYVKWKELHKLLRGYKRIILYGAGGLGKWIHFELLALNYYKIVLWVDRYKAGEILDGTSICSIEDIISEGVDYDCVVICVENRDISGDIKQDLIDSGVPANKIIESHLAFNP